MLTLPRSVRVFLAAGATDLRKSFDGLSGLVTATLREDPLSGHLFLFCNRTRTRLKVLRFGGSGLWVFAKRLETGAFSWPEEHETARVEIRSSELMLLVGGLDLERTRKRRWYERAPA